MCGLDCAVQADPRAASYGMGLGGSVQDEEAGGSGALRVFVSKIGESDLVWIAV